jgi:hypothetical protein
VRRRLRLAAADTVENTQPDWMPESVAGLVVLPLDLPRKITEQEEQ